MSSETQRLWAVPRSPEPPEIDLFEGRYRLRMARTVADVEAVQRLRFEVFDRELGEGLAQSWETGLDADPFDAICHHLVVTDALTNEVVGTYRLQTAAMAAEQRGFYSAWEFDLRSMPDEVLAAAVELGRACVARDHRNTRVLFLLWRGLARYVATTGLRYLFGCCSLPTVDSAEGMALFRWLVAQRQIHHDVQVEPLPPVRLPVLADAATLPVTPPPLPPLFRMYLRHGAKVCGPPAVDRELGTIDYFVLLDVEGLSPRARRAFFA
jgi:putative hemolysin